MDTNFLNNLLSQLNSNKDLLKANIDDFAGMLEPQGTNAAAIAQNKIANRLAPNALNVQMRRTKGSIPLKRMADGRVLYSDSTIEQVPQPQNVSGQQNGFANLQLPQYSPGEDTNPQAELQQAPTDKLTNTLMSPVPEGEGADKPVNIQIPENAYNAFMQQAGVGVDALKAEIRKYLQTPEESAEKQAEDQAITLDYTEPKVQNIAHSAPVRYGNTTMPTNAFIRSLPNPPTSQYDSLLKNDDFSIIRI